MPIPVNRPNSEQPRKSLPPQEAVGLPRLEEEELPVLLPPQREERRAPEPIIENRGNFFDAEDDDTFTPISVDDEELYTDEDSWEEEEKPNPNLVEKVGQRVVLNPVPLSMASTPRAPEEIIDEEDEAEEAPSRFRRKKKSEKAPLKPGYTEDTFIDEEKEKLKPFGRKRAAKVSDFDNRRNMRQKAKFIQVGVLALLAALVGLGLKNAFFPPDSLSSNDVVGIVQSETGSFGFPLDRGGAFAKDFMQAYLTVSQDPGAKAINDQTLSYFYTGTKLGGGAPERAVGYKYNQAILYGPTVYESKELTAYSARYTVAALIQPSTTGITPPTDGSTAQWSFFNVNVYYDKSKDAFLVTPTSPTVVPAIDIRPNTELPNPAKIGTGTPDTELTEKLKSVVYGFVNGYAVSSPSDHTTIDQYVLPNPPPELLKGLNKRYKLAGPAESSIAYQAYLTDDPNVVKAQVSVTWRDGAGETTMDYKSNYIMTLNRQSNGTYLVAKFAPEYFVMATP